MRAAPDDHVDIGSDVNYVGMISVIVPVTFIDIRPLSVDLPHLRCLQGTVLRIPFDDASVTSLSCLHVAEHVGLGRYGDELDPAGTRRACAELERVLAPAGNLYFSVPVGRPRVCFNAHRVHSPLQILDFFPGLELESFSLVDDDFEFRADADVGSAAELSYGCGLFWFRRRL